MGKKGNKKDKEAKKARAEQKLKKNQGKAESKDKKKTKKILADEEEEDDMDLEEMLNHFKEEQVRFEKVVVESVERPSARINASLISNPIHGKRELILFGGEYTHPSNSTTSFYNELFSYTPDNDQWRKISSQNAPMPRSSAAMAAHPSGIALLHGGEFSSPKQSTFYHYSDTWILDCVTKEWTKLDQKNGPSSRSGHRMTVWKNFIIMCGGFRDIGVSTTYLNDCWLFNVALHKWTQVEFPRNHVLPDPRSGHSFIPDPEGAIMWGGYRKVKAAKGLQKGKILADCWTLKMSTTASAVRWEKRKKQGFQPSPRVGCSMVPHKGRGILFGGVYDFEETEERLDSIFYNDLFTYQLKTNRWHSLSIRPQRKKQTKIVKSSTKDQEKELQDLLSQILQKAHLYDQDENIQDDEEIRESFVDENEINVMEQNALRNRYAVSNQLPHPRFNASLVVVGDTLFIYGGLWELGEKEYNIDSFYSIDLNRADGVTILWEELGEINRAKESSKLESDGDDESEEEENDDRGSNDGSDEEGTSDQVLMVEEETSEEQEEDDSEQKNMEILDPRPWLPHPKAFESLRAFYIRTGPQFLQWVISNDRGTRGKHLKKKSFDLCQERWWERRDQIRNEEEKMEELGGVSDIVEKDPGQKSKRR